MLKLWNHLLSLNDDRLTKHIFKWEYANHLCNGTSWINEIKHILELINQAHHFINCSEVDLKFISTLLQDVMEKEWQRNILCKPNITFKNTIKEEEYVSCIKSRKARSLISQIRLGILPLEIEVGRFRGISPEARICQNCNMGVVENELHFICECVPYTMNLDIL